MQTPPRTPFGLRVPDTTRDWIKEKAAEQDRSQNYVICKILEAAQEAENANTPNE